MEEKTRVDLFVTLKAKLSTKNRRPEKLQAVEISRRSPPLEIGDE